ncbi:hypothetical protein PR048_024525 [Dryococelus australis]|uniref:Uncharacterized protein n=1 Tax=Dryococelus australis TaxID=614101 RepID=A0ABQ9GNS8_9NEOP|nr:hypothetical protein PR048_024525 [Dryococelus australis]
MDLLKTLLPRFQNASCHKKKLGITVRDNVVVLRGDEGEGRLVRSSAGMQGRGKREIPEKTRPPMASSATIPTRRNPGSGTPGIEPGSPRVGGESPTRGATANSSRSRQRNDVDAQQNVLTRSVRISMIEGMLHIKYIYGSCCTQQGIGGRCSESRPCEKCDLSKFLRLSFTIGSILISQVHGGRSLAARDTLGQSTPRVFRGLMCQQARLHSPLYTGDNVRSLYRTVQHQLTLLLPAYYWLTVEHGVYKQLPSNHNKKRKHQVFEVYLATECIREILRALSMGMEGINYFRMLPAFHCCDFCSRREFLLSSRISAIVFVHKSASLSAKQGTRTDLPFPPLLHSGAAPYSLQALAVKSSPNLFTSRIHFFFREKKRGVDVLGTRPFVLREYVYVDALGRLDVYFTFPAPRHSIMGITGLIFGYSFQPYRTSVFRLGFLASIGRH